MQRCPKFNYLRTSEGSICALVSEVYPSSDSGWHFPRGRVRSLPVFGQAKAISALWCLKFNYLRTRGGTFRAGVSEVYPSSDSGRLYQCGRVRSLPIFGLGVALSARACPKFTYLRTRGGTFRADVSEVEVTSYAR